MTGLPIRNRLTTFLVAAIFVISGAFALSFLSMDGAFAAKYATSYDYNATATPEDLSTMPGVYRVTVDMNSDAENPQTIGIPSVAKQNLADHATKEMPAIIMGAAVNYEVRTGAIDFTPIAGQELLPPYSYFRYSYGEKQEKNPDGTPRTIKTLTGFDGSYYIVRVDVSNIIEDAEEKAKANGETLDGKFLHVRQENNKALLVATGMTDSSYVWADTSQTNNKGGCKAASYPLANNAEAMKDTSGSDNERTYLDVILMSSAKNVAGADAGSETAPVSNVDLSFYVDDTRDYKPWMEALDPNKMPTFPYTIKDDKGNDVKFETEADYNQGLTTKFFDEANATEANSSAKYRVMGEDLEIDVAIDVNGDSATDEGESRGDWIGENMDFWSMEKAIANQAYDNHTIIMICEVPVIDISNYAATLEKTAYAYTGKEIKPAVKVAGLTAAHYTASYANNKEVGTATVTITPKDSKKYKGEIKATFEITKASQSISKVTPASKKIKAKKGKVKKNTKFTLKAKATGDPAAKMTFTKANKAGKKKIAITKAGKVTVKKGLKKGTYKVKVKVTKAETAHYKAATKTFTIKVIVK